MIDSFVVELGILCYPIWIDLKLHHHDAAADDEENRIVNNTRELKPQAATTNSDHLSLRMIQA